MAGKTAGNLDALLAATDPNRLPRTRRLFAHARAVFDDDEAAGDWLSTPNPALSGHSPLSLLATDSGARRVDVVLTRLEFGVYA
jgi:putative toxin-antitoxin system antitoxin component (TIGR02293 family)